ncbi:MAG: TIGR01212 family radical SAM protein [Bacteroidales bacterium]|nr:TIGR01212 family radical SAM protein [Bacteroidales bacterium]
MHKLYYSFPEFLSQHFEGKVQKISLDAGFSCPNRDGSLGLGGCSYCNNLSFNPSYCSTIKSISVQLAEGKEFFAHKYPKMDYLAYFQSYTNTYDKLDKLIDLYEEALRFPGVKGLVIATRPDCLPEDLLDYLKQLAKRCFLLVELGVESTLDRTLKEIGRGHDYACSVSAIHQLSQRKILCGAHIILGLPGESREDMLSHAGRLNALPINSLKLHQLQLIRGTRLERQVRENPAYVSLFDADSYARLVIEFIERLRPDLVLDRFVSQSPAEWLIGPDWGMKNYEFSHKLERVMRTGGHFQGRLYSHPTV